MNVMIMLAKWNKTKELALANDICKLLWDGLPPEQRKKWEDEAELD